MELSGTLAATTAAIVTIDRPWFLLQLTAILYAFSEMSPGSLQFQ